MSSWPSEGFVSHVTALLVKCDKLNNALLSSLFLNQFNTDVYCFHAILKTPEVGGLGGYKDEQATVTLLREHQI